MILFLLILAATPAALPDPVLTPGDVATTDLKVICKQSTRVRRNVPESVKRQVYAVYHRTRKAGVCCEVDHLISLELGGSNDPKNLWPEPYEPRPGAHEKDVLENWMHAEVCAGRMSIADAQSSIAKDWTGAFQKMKATKKARGRQPFGAAKIRMRPVRRPTSPITQITTKASRPLIPSSF